MRHVWCGLFAVCLVLGVGGAVRADGEAEAKALVDKAIKAAGGEAKLVKLSTAAMKATLTAQDGNNMATLAFDGVVQGLDKCKFDVLVQENGRMMNVAIVIDGDKAWAKHDNKVEEAPEEIRGALRDVVHALRALQMMPTLKGKEYKLSTLGEVKVGDRPALGVQITRKDYRDMNLWLDKETGLPVKLEMQLKDGNQDKPFEFLFIDYKDMDGMKHPVKITCNRDGKKFIEAKIDEVKARDKLEDKEFGKPE